MIQRGDLNLIIGFGLTGQSIARYCLEHKMPCVVVDACHSLPALDNFKAKYQDMTLLSVIHGLEFEQLISTPGALHGFLSQFSKVFVSPGVCLNSPLLEQARLLDLPLGNDIALFLAVLREQLPSVKVVAITGSNGKSTVTDALAFVGRKLGYSCHAIGNIGIAVLDILPDIHPGDIVVIELSSYQLEVLDHLAADIATLLNMSADHLDRHGTLQAYWQMKQKVYTGARLVVVNKDDALSAPLAVHQQPSALLGYSRFGLGMPDSSDFGVVSRGEEPWFAHGLELLQPVSLSALQGEHNVANALAVLALSHGLGWPLKPACAAWCEYKGLAYRAQIEPTSDGITWVNDSKGTNVGASLVALRAAQAQLIAADEQTATNGLWWIAGGLAKGADFSVLAHHIQQLQQDKSIKQILLYGQDAHVIQAALDQVNISQYVMVQTLATAVTWIKGQAIAGDVVVFSPACASMDQFTNFEARGQAFSQAVQGVHEAVQHQGG